MSWRPVLEDPSTLQIFFDYYAITTPPLSKEALECLVRLASVRRSLFTNDGERSKFLAHLMTEPKTFYKQGKLEVIGIDEAQFFEDLYDFCCKTANIDGKIIIVAGLDGDYLRKRFSSMLYVIPLADSVTKLTARCELCGKHAFFTLRKTDDTQTELIAGADVYMPVCRRHYVSGQVVLEAARTVLEERKPQCDSHIKIEVEAVVV